MMSKVVLITLVLFALFFLDARVLAEDGSQNGEPPREGAERKTQNTPDKGRSEEKKLKANSTAGEKASGREQDPNEESDGDTSDKEKHPVSAWVGYSYYAMNDFNRKLSREGNENIDGGINLGIEFEPKGFKVGAFGLEFSPFPIGVEYLKASSKTKHTNGGTSTTVDWELPVIGFYFWPEVHFVELSEEWMDGKGWDLRLRPIGVGYYTLGKLMDAALDISGVPGRLEVEDESIGFMSQIGIKHVSADETQEVFVEGGYRWLKFTSILREPEGGFAGGSPTTMPEDLDYSGFIIKAGVLIRF